MSWKIKLFYLIILVTIITPPILHWKKGIVIQKKQSLDPPNLPDMPTTNEALLDELLARNLWDKNHKKITRENELSDNSNNNLGWVLQGIADSQSPTPSIKITINSQQSTLYLGDRLPKNWKLIEILGDGIVIKKQEKTKHVYLFGKQPNNTH